MVITCSSYGNISRVDIAQANLKKRIMMYEIEVLKQLKQNSTISFEEIKNIIEAYQIASGQGYAIGKTKGILGFLKNYGEIKIINDVGELKLILKTKLDLVSLYKSMDHFIDIKNDVNFGKYF